MSTARDLRPTWAEVDRSAFTRNVDAIVARLPSGSQLIAVLKADAYGHGAIELARLCRADRVAMIATAPLEGSVELRRAGITAPRRHLANSAATMRGLIEPGDLVRVGVALFGAEALDDGSSRLEAILRWRTEIVRLKALPVGHAIGYGKTFRTKRP